MKPLQAVALGLLIVLLGARVHGYDLLPDPIGWLLVLVGLGELEAARSPALRALATVSLLVAGVVWVPAFRDALNVTDPALAWAAGLPEALTLVVLTTFLARAAAEAHDLGATRWLRTSRTLFVVIAVIPPIVIGGGLDALVTAAAVVGSLSLLLLVVLLFRYAERPWALAPAEAH